MEAPSKKKIVAKVTANIYDPSSNSNGINVTSSNVIRAKVSSSSVSRGTSVANGTHSRNSSITRTPSRAGTINFDEIKAFSQPVSRASAPPSVVGKSPSQGLSPNALLLSPESSPSPTVSTNRKQLRVVPQAKKGPLVASPLNTKFKAHQSAASTPISPPTSPRGQQFNYLSEPATSAHGSLQPPQTRPRVVSSIRLKPPQITALNAEGGRDTPLGHRARTPSISSSTGATNRPRIPTSNARISPQQLISPPKAHVPTLVSQSPPTSTLSSRSSASITSASLSRPSNLSCGSTAIGGGDEEQEPEEEQEYGFDVDRAETPQPELDEDSVLAQEAKSNRKMMDLEISNRSLLAVNTMLEATKLRQSQEIKELRRKLREVRHLPTRPIYTNKGSQSPTTSDLSLPNNNSNSSPSSDDEEEPEPDPAYDRIVRLVEGLLSQAQRALERTIDDCMPPPTNTVKVLSAVEIEQYERKVKGLPMDEARKNEEEKEEEEEERDDHEADFSIHSTDDGNEPLEEGDMADDDRSKRKASLLGLGGRRPSAIGKPPD